jgi:hypothetical protein
MAISLREAGRPRRLEGDRGLGGQAVGWRGGYWRNVSIRVL